MSLLTALRPLAVQKRQPTPDEVQVIEGAILGPPGPFGIPPIDDLTDQLRVYSRSALVYRCASIWAEETIQVPLRIFEQQGRTLGAEVLDGPVWDLLGEINGFQAWPEFLYVTMLNLALTGNAFWWKVRNKRGVPVELWSLKPTEIRTERVGDTASLQYRWFPTEIGHPTAGYLFDQASIVHLRLPSPLSDVWGTAPVRAAADDIRADQQAKRSTLGMMDNSALPAGVLTSQQDIGEEQAALIRRQWREVYGGPANAGRIAVLGRGADFKPIAVQPKDIEYMNQRKYSRSGILAAFGVPPIYMGVESENFGNRREQRRQLWQDKLVPMFRLMEGQISERLLRDFDPSYVAILDESRTDVFVEIIGGQMDTADKAVRARLMTPNESRRVFIQPFLRDVQGPVEGGDDFLVPLNMVPSRFVNSGETLGWAEARIEQRAPGAPKAPETPQQAQAIAAGPPPPDITGKRADIGEQVWKAAAQDVPAPIAALALDTRRIYVTVAQDLAAKIADVPPTDTTLDHLLPTSHELRLMVSGILAPHVQRAYTDGIGTGLRQIGSQQVTKYSEDQPRVPAGSPGGGQFGSGGGSSTGDQTNTPAFKAWFGDSKVVDANGKPLVVYHGTTASFDTFSEPPANDGIYFSSDPAGAADYSEMRARYGGDAQIIPAYLRIERDGWKRLDQLQSRGDSARTATGKIKSEGFDGYIAPGGLYVVFSPTQIKSATGNSGAFNPKNPDITKALGDPEDPNSLDLSIPPIFDPQVAEFVRSQVALYSPLIGQDIVDAFRQQLAEGLSMGEDITTLQNRLMQFADLQAPARALRVARTEIADAQNAGAHASYMQNDQVQYKKWVTSHDSHVRPAGSRGGPVFDHVKADGQIVPKDQPFIVSGERMMYPGDRSMGASPGNFVNCRCAASPVVRQ